MSDERLAEARPVALTLNEARALLEFVSDECDRCSDGGSIPPQAWRTAANKLQDLCRAWPS